MASDPDNHTIRLIRDMRDEMRAGFAQLNSEMSSRFSQVDDRLDEVDTRLKALTHMVTMLAANAYDHEQRITALEGEVT